MRRTFHQALLTFIFALVFCCTWIQHAACKGTPPEITEQPSDVVVAKNSPVDFKCSATGSPRPKIFWLHNGVKVLTDDKDREGRRYLFSDGSLHFIRVTSKRKKTDNGIYQCVATNRLGIAYSRNASLLVGNLKSSFRAEPEPQSVYAGDRVVLQCSPPKGRPPPTVHWLRDNTLISNSSRTLISSKGNLTISPVTKADQGSYVCKAKSPLGERESQDAFLTVKDQPSLPLTVEPSFKSILEGESVTFKCHYSGGLQDPITWFKKDGTLPPSRHVSDGKGELTINNVEIEDTGKFVCSVNSASGKLTAEAELQVQSKPRIIQEPTDLVIKEGSFATFTCVAAGQPQPTVFWTKQGMATPMFPNQDNGRFFVKGTGELEISSVKKEDEGVYTCLALSPVGLGSSSAVAQLAVIGPTDALPLVITGPSNQTVDEGVDVNLACEVSGSPEPSVKWYRNDWPFPLRNSSAVLITKSGSWSQLRLANVNVSDQGKYKCEASNNLGMASAETELSVKRCDPIFTTEPNSGNPVYTQGSGSVTFSWDYNADGLTVDKVEWQYRRDISATPQSIARKPTSGQSQVSAGYTGRITFSGSASLTISNIQESDSGIYECWVHFTSLDTPWIISTSELIVVVSPTITLRTTQPVKITEGGSSTLLCVASGNPKPTYTWYRDSTMVQNDQAANSNYTIASATRQDAGNYRCRASVSGGGLGPFNADYTVTVTVKFKPQVDSLSSNQTRDDGSSAFFTCRAVGVPTPIEYKWFDPSDSRINSDPNGRFFIQDFGDSESQLTVKQLQKNDAGKYTCVGSNSLGDGQGKSVFLIVDYAPQQVTITPVALVVKETESITLTCDADGSPAPTYFWIFNGKTIGTAKEKTLTDAKVKDAGNYTCRAKNSRGEKETTRMLNVEYKPTVTNFTTGTPNNAVVRGNKVTLTCTANGYPAPTYVIEKDGAPVTEIAEGVFEINSVQLSEENVIYSCVPTNSMGTGPKIDLRLSVQVPPQLPNAQPQLPQIKLTKTENETQSYSCTYDAKPTATIMWLLNGQNLTNTPPYNITQSFLNVPGSLKIKRTESHLRIDGVTWRQEGQFSCLGMNNAGNLSQTTELEVRYRPVVQTVADHPKNVIVTAGATVVFDCKAIGNPPTEGHKWQFNGVDIPGESCTGCQSRALTKSGVTLSNAGWYSCIGWNSLGDGPPARAQLLINHPPTINIDDPSEYTVNETNFVAMVCRADGVPRPDITWKKAGRNVGSGEELHINSTSEKDHGSYTCEAKNSMGDDSRQILLNMQTRPTIVTSYPMAWNIPGDVGNEVDLSCVGKGNPTPELSWIRNVNGTSLTPDGGSIISISKLKENIVMKIVVKNIGEEYYCVAVNLLGSSHQKYVIRMRGIPDPPINLKLVGIKVIDAKTVSVNVSWTPGYDGGHNQEFSIHYRKKTGTVFTIAAVGQPAGSVYPVEGLKPKTEYVFKVQAQNNLGPSETTSLAQVTTPESSLPPDRGTVHAKRGGDGTTILVTWIIEDDKVTTLNLQYREDDGRWAPVTDATGLSSTVKPEFTVVNVNADKIYQFRMDMRREGESTSVYVYSEEVLSIQPTPETELEKPPIGISAAVYGPVISVMFLIIVALVVYIVCVKRKGKRISRRNDKRDHGLTPHANDIAMELEVSGPNQTNDITDTRSPIYEEPDIVCAEQTFASSEALPHGPSAENYRSLDNRKSRDATGDERFGTTTHYGEYQPLNPTTLSWEIQRENVKIEKVIGKGAFGQVAKATALDIRGMPGKTTVAVKILKENASESDRKDLNSELGIMKLLKPHPHVIKLLACVTSEPLMVLIEYVPYGDLLGYLRRSRGLNDTYYNVSDVTPQTSLTSPQLMRFAWQIADGMSYLSFKNIIHRDLAARNVLVGYKETCKVTDFGMAREHEYERKRGGRLPVRWTAHEALTYGQYTTQSDVWSYGVVLYEIFTIGDRPYPKMNGLEIIPFLQRGNRMAKPKHFEDDLYQLMLNCWNENPHNRPTFESLKVTIKELENSRKKLIHWEKYDKTVYENVDDCM